jgi:hypothetical protein
MMATLREGSDPRGMIAVFLPCSDGIDGGSGKRVAARMLGFKPAHQHLESHTTGGVAKF